MLPSAIVSKRSGEEHLANLLLAPQLLKHKMQGREWQQPSSHKDRDGMVEPSTARATSHIQAKGSRKARES
jgi:hypothetical protein